MRFKQGKQGSDMPHLDLVPLMDVILSVLVFFILGSLSLSRQQAVDVTLPSTGGAGAEQNAQLDPLVVGLNQQGQILLDGQVANQAQLAERIKSYLTSNPKGAVILKADRNLAYEQVVKVLGKMRDVGGERVSLAINS